mmetsp:Transcript_8515/g.10936  ORF Transcript_8515/g.10936 Transcript_8515/m.10936 type:complete len:361 (+) Transcript_8515:85-1167(+)|eukprot:CAMPEP_0116069598 /NCGR_PEP_ID=MMETSP0322-20121206/12400_1 /TAXON_ID=163516 /ORGANISM="Leptocylindrus danicus var. apora, Strain B651" /LENGTH=360 /DNA_ID=CAMNT_0003557027 /DNA_START=28 /DNA_END=1110 /DNA_ORIENTATION=-
MGIKIDATEIAKPYRQEVQRKVQALKDSGIEAPLLVGLLANDDPAALKYAEWTGKACRADGLRYELRKIEDPINVEQALRDANNDVRVHGVIVYYPIFGAVPSYSGSSRDDYLRDSVSHEVDVEGLCHLYRSNLYQNVRYVDSPRCEKKCVLPCTALSVVKILESLEGAYDKSKPIGERMKGKVVTVINRSEIVGRPLAAMLANDGASVYSVDIESIYNFADGKLHKCEGEEENLEACVRKSDVVITGVPVKGYRLPTQWIAEGSIVVNVASYKNIDEDMLLKIKDVQYVSMVGKVTVAMLERNLVRLFENYHHPDLRKEKVTYVSKTNEVVNPWYGSPIQLYTALAITTLLAVTLTRKS